MINADEAKKIILQDVPLCSAEAIPLDEALARTVAEDIRAPISLPPFDNAAMDGFAVRSGDLSGPFSLSPVSLYIAGVLAAGDAPVVKLLTAGEAIRIMTGAPLPAGADAVVPIEDVEVRGGQVGFQSPVPAGQHVRRAGEDIRQGNVAVVAGTRITSRQVALLAALGIPKVSVRRKPRVAVLATGSELVEAGQALRPGQIYNSNGPTLRALLQEAGAEGKLLGQTADTVEALRETIGRALEDRPDIFITMGGVSAGDFDLVPKVLKDLGAVILFHKVAIKPGKPLLFARLGSTLVFGLPGNPVSSYMVYDRFVRPVIARLLGRAESGRCRRKARVEGTLKGAEGKEVYLRGIVTYREGQYVARSAGSQASAMLTPLERSNAVLLVPAQCEKMSEGDTVEFEFFTEVL